MNKNMPPNGKHPPRLGEKLLRSLLSGEDRIERMGDFAELYLSRLREAGRVKASLWYASQALRLIFSRFRLCFLWKFTMLKNFWLTAQRNFKRHLGSSLVNLFCLTLGMTAFLMIAVWVRHELSYDRFHDRANRIHRVVGEMRFSDQTRFTSLTPGPLAADLMTSFPEIQAAARMAWAGERVVGFGEELHYESEIATVDPVFLSMFSFPLIRGDADSALRDLNSIVLTEAAAEKYFGTEDPMGRMLSLDNRFDLTVTGVMADPPANSHIRFNMLVPFEMVERLGWMIDAWDFNMARTYLLLDEAVDSATVSDRIAGWVQRHDGDSPMALFLQPLTRIHLFSNFEDGGEGRRFLYVSVFGMVGILILIMACINFVNLATARSELRALEIGVRKIVGASRPVLIGQFLAEAVFLAGASLLCSPLLIGLLLPLFNRMAGEAFAPSDFFHAPLPILAAGALLGTGLLAGGYPALLLSSFQPLRALRRGARVKTRGSFLRKSLVVIQVAVSVILVFVSWVVYRQIDFLKRKDLGFDKTSILSVPLGISNPDNPGIYKRFRAGLESHPMVERVSAAFTHPTRFGTQADRVVVKGRRLDEQAPVFLTSVEFDFVETLGIEILAGRSFSREFGADRGNLIVNRRFAEMLGEGSVLNTTVSLGEDYRGRIVGVMRDFHIEGVTESLIGPLILFCNPGVNYIFVRLMPGNVPAALDALEAAWKHAAPDLPFRYNFLDEEFERFTSDIAGLAAAIRAFTVLAAVIACLGLLGLASYAAARRTKEIGIRKLMGSSTEGLVCLLAGDFFRLVLLANLGAWPVAWLVARRWLRNFPYRMTLDWVPFVLSGLLVLAAALLTVGATTLRAAAADPVRSLRDE